jgi:hypothetical protein
MCTARYDVYSNSPFSNCGVILDVHLLLYWCARSQGRLNRTERTIFHWSINRDLDRVLHKIRHTLIF